MEQKTVWKMNVNELDQIFREWYGHKDFEAVAEFEWDNDSYYSIEVGPESINSLSAEELKDFEEWKRTGQPQDYLSEHQILQGLYLEGILEAGEYIIDVCW